MITEPILPDQWEGPSAVPIIPSKVQREMTRAELFRAEQVIGRGKQAFIEVGEALIDIRERKGYKLDGYETFGEYCEKRWHFSIQQAGRLMRAADVLLQLQSGQTEPIGSVLPENEAQARPLSALETPEEKQEAWKEAIATAPDGKITAEHIKATVDRRVGRGVNSDRTEKKEGVNWSEYALSASNDEKQILKWIMHLYNHDKPFDLDPTYSTGRIWQGLTAPRYRSDLAPRSGGVEQANSRHLRFQDAVLESIFFDPPFVIKDPTRENGKLGINESRFSGYATVEELWSFYEDSLSEFYRVLRPGGIVALKCGDVVSAGRQVWSSSFIQRAAEEMGFEMIDRFILVRENAMMSPNMANQIHSRKNYCFIIVLRKI